MQRAVQALGNHGAAIQVAAAAAAASKPRGLEALFELERMLLRRGVPGGADAIPFDDVAAGHPANARADLVIDFATRTPCAASREFARTLTPLYDGVAGEDGILAAVMAGDLPRIEILDSKSGAIVASGHPSSEAAAGLSGALDSVMARTVTLLARVLAGGATAVATGPANGRTRTLVSPARYVLSGLASSLAREIYRLCCYAPHWRVGWRFNAKDRCR